MDSSPSSSSSSSPLSLRVVVIGGTGAIGRSLVSQLVESPHFSKITCVGRREVPEWNSEKIEQKVIDMESLAEEKNREFIKDHDVAFCTLGTTRKDAGSAKQFKKVDFDMVLNFATHCRNEGVPHFQIVTSQGANPSSPFLYPKTKGRVEEELKKKTFPILSIFRPGLLDRGKEARFVEKLGGWILPTISVTTVAKAMIENAINHRKEEKNAEEFVEILENSKIKNLAKE